MKDQLRLYCERQGIPFDYAPMKMGVDADGNAIKASQLRVMDMSQLPDSLRALCDGAGFYVEDMMAAPEPAEPMPEEPKKGKKK